MNKKIVLLLGMCGLVLVACQRIERVTGRVWHDGNGDGVRDESEPWLEGVQVNLHSLSDDATSFIATTETDGSGTYRFDLTDRNDPAELEIRVTALDGMAFSDHTAGGTSSIGSDVDPAGGSGQLAGFTNDDAAVVNAGMTGLVPGHAVDGEDDAVDCEQTLAPTGQALPPFADIVQVSWVGAERQVKFEIALAVENLSAAFPLDEGDFIGLGLEFLDPRGMLPSDTGAGWLPDSMGNFSLNVIRDPASDTFFVSRFAVQAGRWLELPGPRYPVELSAGSFIVTVPVDVIPAGARGFVLVVMFDADASEIFCDLAGIDEQGLVDLSTTPGDAVVRTAFDVISGRAIVSDLPYQLSSPNALE